MRISRALALTVLLLVGCGVKGPPKPLYAPPPLPEITGFAYELADDKVTLNWQLTAPLTAGRGKQALFVIRRSQSALDQPNCEDCPQVFATTGKLPYVERENLAYVLDLPIEAGYRYLFTVHLETGGEVGPKSDPLKVEVPLNN